MANSKVRVTVGDKSFEIEGEAETVAGIIAAVMGNLAGNKLEAASQAAQPGEAAAQGQPGGRVPDIRSFFEEKKPTSHTEAAACVAYFFQYVAPPSERRETINTDILRDAFHTARWKRPKELGQVLVDARKFGYFDKGAERGEYKLNAVGYNLVGHTLGQAESRGGRK